MGSEAVEDHLAVECAVWNGRTRLMVATSEGFEPRPHFEAELEALDAIGLLEPGEATAWLRRFDEAAAPDAPLEADQALRARADRYLESLLPIDPFDHEAGRALEITLDLLEGLKIFSSDDAMRWRTRSMPPELEEEDDEVDEPVLRCRALSRVLAGPKVEVAGIRVVSVELFEEGVLVRWTSLEDVEPPLELSDDVGTAYELAGAGWGSGGSSRVRGAVEFVPAVAADASRLRLAVAGREFELELAK